MDFSKPHLIFMLTWAAAFALATSVKTPMSVDFDWQIYLLVFGGMLSFYVVATAFRLAWPLPAGTPAFPRFDSDDLDDLAAFVRGAMPIWLVGFIVTILYSGGIPLLWVLLGDPRNYLDFGMPTVSGLLNMMRAFLFTSVVGLALEKRARPVDYLIAGFLLATALAEISRGGITLLLLHGIAARVLLRPVKLKGMLLWAVAIGAFFLLFDWVGQVRTTGHELKSENVLGDAFAEDTAFAGLAWSFIYLTSPLNNLAYAVSQDLSPLMTPFYTLQPLLPTVLRDIIFGRGDYPIELINEAYNATSFYSPLVADFGVIGAFLGFVFIQIIIVAVHRSAKHGNLFAMLIYPPVFASVALSFFYSYFFALSIVMYPLMAAIFLDFRRRRRSAPARLARP